MALPQTMNTRVPSTSIMSQSRKQKTRVACSFYASIVEPSQQQAVVMGEGADKQGMSLKGRDCVREGCYVIVRHFGTLSRPHTA